MKGHYSIIKYYPDIHKEEGFGIGLILIESRGALYLKSSKSRIKRINSAFGIQKSKLLEIALKEIEKDTIDLSRLSYLSKYENGIIRYTEPKIIVAEDLAKKFEAMYNKYIADYSELTESLIPKKSIWMGRSFRTKLENDSFIKERISIYYKFEKNVLNNYFFNNTCIDFIGGNGNVYCGEILNLDNEEETIKGNFHKMISIFEALEKKYMKINRFEPHDCKILINKEQADKKENATYMDILNNWQKSVGYELIIKDELDKFIDLIKRQIEAKNIIPFDEWDYKISLRQLTIKE